MERSARIETCVTIQQEYSIHPNPREKKRTPAEHKRNESNPEKHVTVTDLFAAHVGEKTYVGTAHRLSGHHPPHRRSHPAAAGDDYLAPKIHLHYFSKLGPLQ